MARLNEYLPVSDPLRQAYASKAFRLSNPRLPQEITNKIIKEGALFGELTENEQAELIKLEPAISTAPVRVTFTNKMIGTRTGKISTNYKKTIIRPRFAYA